jgi:hypothetical protein
MTSKWKIARVAAATTLCIGFGGGCGNYSNDDVDFELALPDKGDMEAKLQIRDSRVDSAEYYKTTRSAVLAFNGLIVNLTAFVDTVRGYAPTSRNGNARTWGPFADDKNAGWQLRVVMQRSTESATLLHMDYWVQVRPAGQGDSAWVSLLVGQYTSQGGARAGYGDIHFNVQDVRKAGYPIDSDPGLTELDHLDVCYDRSGEVAHCSDSAVAAAYVDMQIVNLDLPTVNTKAAHYVYESAQDNSGHMQYDVQGKTDKGLPYTATMYSRWLSTGEGRADLKADVTPNLPRETLLGADCWRSDTVATYSFRLDKGGVVIGTDTSVCALP